MKKHLLLFGLSWFSILRGQLPTFQWAESFQQTTIRFITADAAGNTYISGSFNGTTDFDPGPAIFNLSSAGGDDAFFLKLNSSGNLVWAKRIGGSSFDDAEGIAVDNSGNVYVTGGFGWTVDFDPGPGTFNLSSGSTIPSCYCNAFVLKLDAAGNFVWAGKFDSFVWSYGYSVKVDAASNVYLTGGFQSNIDLDPSPVNNYSSAVTSQDTYLIKLNSSGNFVWGETFGIMSMSRFFDMDVAGNIYWPGSFSNTADFDPGPGTFTLTSVGNNDCFILKLNNLGNFSWVKQIGGTGNDSGGDLKLDGTGNMYIIGSYQNTIDLDPGTSTFTVNSAGNEDIFILKLNNTGNFTWAKTIGSSGSENAYSLALDQVGSPILAGSFQNTLDFDPGPGTFNISPIGSYEAYLMELNSSGNFIGCISTGGTTYAFATNITFSGLSDIYATGVFNSTSTDFDPGVGSYTLASLGSGDNSYVQKLSNWSLFTNELMSKENISLFPNPTSGLSQLILKEKSQIIVSDVLGREIISEKKDLGKQTIDLQNQPSGIYFIKVIQEDRSETIKLIKE